VAKKEKSESSDHSANHTNTFTHTPSSSVMKYQVEEGKVKEKTKKRQESNHMCKQRENKNIFDHEKEGKK